MNGAGSPVAGGNSGRMDDDTVGWLRQELGLPESGNRGPGVNVAAGDRLTLSGVASDVDDTDYAGIIARAQARDAQQWAEAQRRNAWIANENAVGGRVQSALGSAPIRTTETPMYDGGLIGLSSASLSQLEAPSEALQTLGVAAESAVRAGMELPLMGVDLIQAAGGTAYTMATGKPVDLTMYSGMGRGAQGGATVGESLQALNPMYGLFVAQHDIRQGLQQGSTRPLAAFGGSLLGGAVAGVGMTRLPAATPRFIAPPQAVPAFGSLQPPVRPIRPSWRASELDLEAMYGQSGYTAQASFLKGQPVSRGTPGSTRPDLYAPGVSVDIKNYNLATARGQRNLVRDVVAQAQHRAQNLPSGDLQKLVIDARGQNVSTVTLNRLAAQIQQRGNGVISTQDVTFWR